MGAERKGIERCLKMSAEAKHPIRIGLRRKNGEWLSILGGWREFDRAVMMFQITNARDYAQNSLCTVLRGYWIEALIARNIRNILIWAGGPLVRHCWFLPATAVHLDVPTFTWRTLRRLIGWTASFLPWRMRLLGRWVSRETRSPGSD